MNYFFVRASRPMSNGRLPFGYAYGGDIWYENGITGPHTEKNAKRIMALAGGIMMSYDDGLNYQEAITKGADPHDLFFGRIDAEEFVKTGLPNKETREAIEEVHSEVNVTYQQALKEMAAAGFDWESVTGGSRKKSDVMKAYAEYSRSAVLA